MAADIKTIEILNPNSRIFEQGEAMLGVSPFDNYYMFTIYNDKLSEVLPLDLTNVGTLYLNFIDTNEDLKIKNYENTDSIDKLKGQVLFKISKELARKILSFKNNKFYISSRLSYENTSSDETVLYTGIFYEYTKTQSLSLSNQFEDYKKLSTTTISDLKNTVSSIQTELTSLKNELTIISKQASLFKTTNENLITAFESIKSKMSASDIELINKNINQVKEQSVTYKDYNANSTNTTSMSEKELESLVNRNNKTSIVKLNYNNNSNKQ